MKVMVLLKMAGLPYEEDHDGYSRAPKGKLPYVDDDGAIVADSTLIRWHLEKAHGVDFDAGLSPEQRAASWAAEKMCEGHLYWFVARGRWMDNANFARGPGKIFDGVPAPIRPLVKAMVRRKVAGALQAQGAGRYDDAEATALATRDVETLATLLGERPYFFGEKPCAADASLFAFVAGVLAPIWESPIKEAAERQPNLVAYRDRMMREYFSDFE
jgi:glutathione S-transferase